MNRDLAKKFLPLIQAFAEGKEIEYRTTRDSTWRKAATPTFDDYSYEYRVKPEPVVRKVYLKVYGSGSVGTPYSDLDSLKDSYNRQEGSFIMTLTITDGVPSATFEPYE